MSMITDFEVGSIQSVDVTHINDPHSFYVRLTNVNDSMEAIEKPGSPVSAEELKAGLRVIYKSNVLSKYVRGEISFIHIDELTLKCDIFAIDYGCLDKSILLEQIHSLEPKAQPENQCPALAIHCQLYLCEPIGDTFTDKVIDAMKYFVGKHTATVTIKSKEYDKYIVELETVDSPHDVAMMLGLLHYTTFMKFSKSVSRFGNSLNPLPSTSSDPLPSISSRSLTPVKGSGSIKKPNYHHRNIKVGDTLHVRVLSGESLSGFYVAEIKEYKAFIRSQPTFGTNCKYGQMRVQDIVPGLACAVKMNMPAIYERAIVQEIIEPGSKALLKLVDWGKVVEASFISIKPVASHRYYDKPILAIYCSTDEGQVWKTGLPTFLYPGYEFVIKIKELGNGFQQPHKVNLYPYYNYDAVML